MDAFDSDVLIYAATAGHPLGRRILGLFHDRPVSDRRTVVGVGSVLLLPDLLAKPTRNEDEGEIERLGGLLRRLELRPTDHEMAEVAVILGARYNLRAADAVHLATAVVTGADRFITNNRRHFPRTITEVDITYPEDLPEPTR